MPVVACEPGIPIASEDTGTLAVTTSLVVTTPTTASEATCSNDVDSCGAKVGVKEN